MILKGYTEEEIETIMKYYGREREVEMWGQKCIIKPCIIENVQGDGLQAVYLTPINTRPNYYVLRIDSSIDIENEELFFEGTDEEIEPCEMLLQMIEEEVININDYKEEYIDGKYIYTHWSNEEDVMTEEEMEFPVLHWSGGSWGRMCDVGHILK